MHKPCISHKRRNRKGCLLTSGYSEFVNTGHREKHSNVAKDKIFTVIGRGIAAAVKEGGIDPVNSGELRNVVTKAETSSTPNDTIDRGIKKAAGDANSVNYKTLTYEGYSPNGIAIIVNTLTDNKDRMAVNVRSAFTGGGGNIGAPGSVSYMFGKKEQIIIDKGECDMDPDELMMLALNVGAEDFSEEENSYEAVTAPENFSAVCKALEIQSIPTMQADMTMIP